MNLSRDQNFTAASPSRFRVRPILAGKGNGTAHPIAQALNCYYLGLLFTLTSLGVALFRFSMAEAGAEVILRNFGIAIATTIFGLALRVMISQFRVDTDDLEYESKAALAETVRALRGELDRSVAELQSFAIGTRQALQEVYDSTVNAALKSLPETFTRFETAANNISSRFETAAKAFDASTGSIEASMKRISVAADGLGERINVVRTDPDLLDKAMKPALDTFQSRVTGFADALDGEKARLNLGLEGFLKLSETLSNLGQSTDALLSTSQRLDAAAHSIGQGADAVARLDTATRTASDAANSYSTQITRLSEQQARQGQDAFDALSRATELLAQKAVDSTAMLDESARKMAAAISSLNEEFSGSGEAVQRVRQELAELAAWIIARIDAK